ncbi:hypothetical protein L0222_12890 [bacterium]|nr:hypothetical protein [bacterium]
MAPAVSGGRIAWVELGTPGYGGRPSKIILYDIKSGKKRTISRSPDYVDLSGDLLVEDWDRGESIRVTDLKTGKVKRFGAGGFYPRISGHLVTFFREHDPHTIISPWDLYLYDLQTGEETLLIENIHDFNDIDLSDDLVVWSSFLEVRVYDVRKKKHETIAINPGGAVVYPRISGRTVTFTEANPISGQPNFIVGPIRYAKVPDSN